MIITCGECQARFKVAPEQIKEGGSKVRCSNCQHVFIVHRPAPEAEAAPSPERDRLDELFENIAGPAESPGDDFDENLAKLLDDAPGPALPEKRPPSAEAAPTERRANRRALYSDLEDEPGKSTFDDSLDELFDDDDAPQAPHPPLRRARRAAAGDKDGGPPPDYEADGAEDELPPPLEERRNRDALGLAADPARGTAPAAAKRDRGASIRGADAGEGGKNSRLWLTLAIVAAFLAAGLYFMANRPEPTALSVADQPQELPPGPDGAPAAGPAGPGGTAGINFSKNNQNHYFRNNAAEGTLLIITGLVRNDYPAPRSFIHLRGRLLSADGTTLADRYAYAGNLVSEEELMSLPISEIFSRLSIKGGQNGRNMNIEPGREVPFMLVFNKLPDGMAEYRIDPMGSSPSE